MFKSCVYMLALLSVVLAGELGNETTRSGPVMKYFIFREDCFDKFVNKKEFSDQDCLKFTLSKAIGFAIIVGSAIVKLPQIIKIVSNGSV